jgi:host factor-I protein
MGDHTFMASSDTAARRATDADLIGNRKLIRPSLSEIRERLAKTAVTPNGDGAAPTRIAGAAPPPRPVKRQSPPDQTNAETFYYLKQMHSKTPMVIVLQDGERVHGIIEWYDRTCLKVHRTREPNVLIYKSNIKYLYKESEASGHGRD